MIEDRLLPWTAALLVMQPQPFFLILLPLAGALVSRNSPKMYCRVVQIGPVIFKNPSLYLESGNEGGMERWIPRSPVLRSMR